MATAFQPTLQDVLLGFRRFNQWQEEEAVEQLPQMTVAEGLDQFFELCDLVRSWRPEPELELQWLEEERVPWIKLVEHQRQEKKG
jgi:hypothetical protein